MEKKVKEIKYKLPVIKIVTELQSTAWGTQSVIL